MTRNFGKRIKIIPLKFRQRIVFKAIGEGRNRKLCVPESALEHTMEMSFVTTARVRVKREPRVDELINRRSAQAKGFDQDETLR